LKGWTLLGVLLAVIGVVVFLNGLNNRLGSHDKASLPKRESLPTSERPPDTTRLPDSPAELPSVVQNDSIMLSPSSQKESTQNQEVEIFKAKPNSISSTPVLDELGTEPVANDFQTQFNDDPGGRKSSLLKVLRDNGWTRDELEQLAGYLNDPRTVFRSEILVRNSTFTESAEQYGHNLTAESISRSLKFIDDHRETLESARTLEGVPVEILVAILKVETNLGEWRGKESVFNVFWSLSLGDHPSVQNDLLSTDPTKVVEMKGRMNRRANGLAVNFEIYCSFPVMVEKTRSGYSDLLPVRLGCLNLYLQVIAHSGRTETGTGSLISMVCPTPFAR